jgi:hypothetical protein
MTLEHEAGPPVGAQELSWHFRLREIVEHLYKAVQRNDVVDIMDRFSLLAVSGHRIGAVYSERFGGRND